MERKGIISAGNWLGDNIKIIERYPTRGNLTTISRIETGLGGCSHNVLADLARTFRSMPAAASAATRSATTSCAKSTAAASTGATC